MDVRRQSIVNTHIMEYMGFFKILNPHSSEFYGINVLKLIAKIELFVTTLTLLTDTVSLYYVTNDLNMFISYLFMGISLFGIVLNQFYLIKYSDTIWNCMRVIDVDFLYFVTPVKKSLILEKCKYKIFSIYISFSWLVVYICWIFSPIFQETRYLTINFNNIEYNYIWTPINLMLLLCDKFYNKHYVIIYVCESISIFCCTHVSILFDLTVITICICIEYQFQYISSSYSTFIFVKSPNKNITLKNTQDDETRTKYNFIKLIEDNQRIIKYLRIFYQIFRPLILIQIATSSACIILACGVVTMNLQNGVAPFSPMNVKMFSALLLQALHLFIFCQIFTSLNDKKESISFSLYCSDWTQTNIYFKKLILLAMRIDVSEKSTLKISAKKRVDMEMFASVLHMAYSITSVLARSYGNARSG